MVAVFTEEISGRDAVTQETSSLEVVAGLPMVEVVAEEIPGRDVVTQEPAPPEVTSKV